MDSEALQEIFDLSYTWQATTGCWIWSGLTDRDGRPVVRETGGASQHSARRWAWQQERGKIPRSQRLRNTCGNVLCVAPDHAEVYSGLPPPPPQPPRANGRRHGRPGPRPDMWVTGPDPVVHRKYLAWLQQRNQAQWRGETWNLSFEEWQALWGENWPNRGRERGCYCMTRRDHEAAWDTENAQVITREEHARQQGDLVARGMRSPRQTRRRQQLGLPT